LSSIGPALEYYDFTVFVFLALVLSSVFFPAHSPAWIRLLQTYAIFALGYIVRPIAGIVLAHLGDKVGRKKMFMLSLFLMAVPTLCIGLLPPMRKLAGSHQRCCWGCVFCKVVHWRESFPAP
jgi:MFS family permease